MKEKIPKFIHPYLWFNDLDKMDLRKNKERIIINVLNFGSRKATNWLFDIYTLEEIKKVVINYGAKGELSNKSLNYWCLVLKIDLEKLSHNRF